MADPIDREAAIEAIVNTVSEIGNHDNSEVARYGATFRQHEIIDILERMPSAQPEAKTPTWKEEDRFVKGYFTWYPYCPKCGHEVVTGQCYCEICGQHIDWSEDDE